MLLSARRLLRGILFVFLSIVALHALPGCGAGPAVLDIVLSASRLTPGKFLTISHPSIVGGTIVDVDFTSPDRPTLTATATSMQDGSVDVMVPPMIDASGTAGSGDVGVTVSVRGIDSKAHLEIGALPSAGALAPGAGLRALLQSVVEDHQATLAALAILETNGKDDLGIAELVSDLNAQIATLQDDIAMIESSGTLNVHVPDVGVVTLTGNDLVLADQLIVASLNGALEELQLEPIVVVGAKRATRLDATPEELQAQQQQMNAEVQAAIKGIKGTLALGINSGRVYNGLVSLSLTVGGFVVAAEGAPVFGAVSIAFGVGRALWSFATAPLLARSTQALNGNDGPAFDASSQVLVEMTNATLSSQATNVTLPPLPTPGDPFTGVTEPPPGAGPTIPAVQITQELIEIHQAVVANRCIQQQLSQPSPINRRSADLGDFCAVVAPMPEPETDSNGICLDTCASARDGVCGDGGPGSESFANPCDFGTDCTDCGARSACTVDEDCGSSRRCESGTCVAVNLEDDDCPLDGFCSFICLQGTDPDCDLCGAEGTCIDHCLFEEDPDCSTAVDPTVAFTFLSFSNSIDGTFESGAGLDSSRSPIQLSGDPAMPTISWSGFSNVSQVSVTSGTRAVYGISAVLLPEDNDGNGVNDIIPFAFDSVKYGTFGLPNTEPLESPSGPLGPADAIPLTPGTLATVTVTIFFEGILTLQFRVN